MLILVQTHLLLFNAAAFSSYKSATCFGGLFGRIAIASPRAALPPTLHGTQQQRPLSGKERLRVGIVGESEHQESTTLNYTMPSANQKLKNQVRSLNCFKSRNNASLSSESVSALTRVEKEKQSEEPLRKVMYFSCWGPN
ncbi:hypothetical protein NL676_016986 [Syzygium grande]|nr:hypothetical protein NL676_016986 [Syzygium grande]